VVDPITVTNAKQLKKHQQNAHNVEAIILPTTKVAKFISEYYHNIIKGSNTFRNNTQPTPPVNTNMYRNNIKHSVNSQQKRSYADVTKSDTNQVEDTAVILKKI